MNPPAPVTRTLCVLVLLAIATSAQTAVPVDKKAIMDRMIKVADWQIAHPNHKPYEWHNGAFYAGVFAAWCG